MTKRKIQAVLRESAFAPNKPGPLKAIADAGNTEYYIRRAMEFAQDSLNMINVSTRAQSAHLTQAISLLALAKLQIEDDTPTQ